jgi:hypothetical protein
MHTTLAYFLVIFAIMIAIGGIVVVVALRNAPEGFEDENGFTGLTKGDEVLLNEFAHQRYAFAHAQQPLAA